jgi:hypothetical protein
VSLPHGIHESDGTSRTMNDDGQSEPFLRPNAGHIEESAPEYVPKCHWDRLSLCMFGASLVFFILSGVNLLAAVVKEPSDLQCAKKTSAWSPLLNQVEYIDVDFQNNFTQPSNYRGPPTPQLELDWLTLVHSKWRLEGWITSDRTMLMSPRTCCTNSSVQGAALKSRSSPQ